MSVFSITWQFYLSASFPTRFTKSSSRGSFEEVDGNWKQICQNEEPDWTNKPWPRHHKSTMSNKQENYQHGHIKTAQTQPNITATLIQPLPVTGRLGNRARNLGSVWQMKCPWITFPVLSSSSFSFMLCAMHFKTSSVPHTFKEIHSTPK